MAEILHFEILRKHGQTNTQTNTHTNKQTHTQTDMGITIPRPPPMGGRGNTWTNRSDYGVCIISKCALNNVPVWYLLMVETRQIRATLPIKH